jgi:hypothetical protein
VVVGKDEENLADSHSPHRGAWWYMAKEHLKEFRPRLYKELAKEGRLVNFLDTQLNEANTEFDLSLEAGLGYDGAWERAKCYLLLPDEREVPDLANNRYLPD